MLRYNPGRDVGAELRANMDEYGLPPAEILKRRAARAQMQLDEETLNLQDQMGGVEGQSSPAGSLGQAGYSEPQRQQFRMSHLAHIAGGLTGVGAVPESLPDVGPVAGIKRARQLADAQKQTADFEQDPYLISLIARAGR